MLSGGHQVPGEGAEVLKPQRVLRRDDQAEVLPVLLAPGGEGAVVGLIGVAVDPGGSLDVAGHALAHEVGDVFRERCRSILCTAMSDHRGLDGGATVRAGHLPHRSGEAVAWPEHRVRPRAWRRGAAVARVPGTAGGVQHLRDETLSPRGLPAAVPNAAKADIQVVVGRAHHAAGCKRRVVPRASRCRLALPRSAARTARRWHSESLARSTVSARIVPQLLSRRPESAEYSCSRDHRQR
jgi:hypothetical protein